MRSASRAACLLLPLLFGACATPDPALRRGGAALTAEWPADRQVVVTVPNGTARAAAEPGSSGKAYGALARYQASSSAIRDADDIAHRHRLRPLAAWPITVLDVHCVVFAVEDSRAIEEVVRELRADEDVESAQALQTFRTQSGAAAQVDPYASLQDGLETMQIMEAHRRSTGSGVRIAIVDSGVDARHVDLAGRVVIERDFTGRRAPPGRHGTAVGGVIAATAGNAVGIAGVAPQSKLVALRACWEPEAADPAKGAICNTLTLAEAIGAAISDRADIINLSLTGPSDPLLERLIERALRLGKTVVAAVPEGDAGDGFPATMKGVIAVARSGHPAPSRAAAGALFAPGTHVLTLRPGGGYDFEDGSSMSAAQVSGVAALLLSLRPKLAGAQLRTLLRDASTSSTPADTRAGPVVNACRAILALGEPIDCSALRSMHAARR